MSDENRSDRIEERPPRRPYEPPRVEQDETFETLALACGKTSGAICGSMGGFQS